VAPNPAVIQRQIRLVNHQAASFKAIL